MSLNVLPGRCPKRAQSRLVLFFALATILIAPQALAAEFSDGVVRIGIINDQAGPLSDSNGRGSVIAAKLAAEDFQKTSPSIKVDIISADHQNKADIGVGIVRKWFDVDGVDMVADVGNSAVGLAIQSIARDKNKIVIYSSVATTELTGKQCAKTGLAWLHDSYNLVAGPIRTLVSQGYDTWFFIAADYAFGKNMVLESQRALAAAGGKSLGAVFHPLGNADYSSFLLQAQASGAKVVAFANAGEQLVTSMKQWNEFGMNVGPQKPVAELMFITDVHAMGPETSKGLTSLTAWYWARNDETRAFSQRFYKLHGAMPTEPQAAVYSGVFHYLKSVVAAGTDATDSVLEKMRSTPVDDFYARGAKIREDGKLIHDFYLVQVKEPSAITALWEYYNVLKTVSSTDAYLPLADSECPLVKK
ncbi:ABC transporter substrate-binding protein [Bradyrhizobium prioriisuperbiae]|uniref:ABC transporter substrate-binding protein n=1 Tax=Bradyrhizobium prioriisuperbiae TaxID=2854389 RepID=UPI0028E64FAE|nr:ABC transporter substrate-binding protein [Bradyrhizobium prioritasuperba]